MTGLGLGGSHHFLIVLITLLKKSVMNPKTICNLFDAAKFLMPVEKIPLQLRVIILKFSGHLKVGTRSLQFVVY